MFKYPKKNFRDVLVWYYCVHTKWTQYNVSIVKKLHNCLSSWAESLAGWSFIIINIAMMRFWIPLTSSVLEYFYWLPSSYLMIQQKNQTEIRVISTRCYHFGAHEKFDFCIVLNFQFILLNFSNLNMNIEFSNLGSREKRTQTIHTWSEFQLFQTIISN